MPDLTYTKLSSFSAFLGRKYLATYSHLVYSWFTVTGSLLLLEMQLTGATAVMIELSLWNVTCVKTVEAMAVSGAYVAFSSRRCTAGLLTAACNPGVWMCGYCYGGFGGLLVTPPGE